MSARLARTSAWVAALVMLSGPASAVAQADTPVAPIAPEAIDRLVAERSEAAGVPGVAWAIVGVDGIEHQGASGVDGDGNDITADTPFLWGSASKPVTAGLVVLLARDGLLDLDDRAADHLPALAGHRYTVRDLLEHTSGLPAGLELTDRYDDGRSITHLVHEIADLSPTSDPGSAHSYSSLNYVVLGAVVEAVTGEPYAEALRTRVLEPAGMDSTTGDKATAEAMLPAGHRYVLGRARAFDTQVDPATVPAGYLVGSIEGLASFARTQLPDSELFLDRELRTAHAPAVATGGGDAYGLGWRSTTVPGTDEPVVWHGGAAPGYHSAVVVLPNQDKAVVVLQNAYGPFADAPLTDTAWALAAQVAGTHADVHDSDPTYPALLAGLGLIVLVLLVSTVRTAMRTRAGSRFRTSGLVTRLGVLATLAGALGFLLPGLFGVTLAQVGLWAPDVAWLTYTALTLCAALAALHVTSHARHQPHRAPTPASAQT